MAACLAWTTTACSESPSSPDTNTSTADTSATDTTNGSDADMSSSDTTDSGSPDTTDGGPTDTATDTTNADVADADADFGGDCGAIADEFDRVVAANQECTTDDDCVRAAAPDTWCDCGPILTGVVNKSAAQRTQQLQNKYAQCPGAQQICDVAPNQNIHCDNGMCVGDSTSCLQPDTGG
jgi:hypothetical protein